MLMIVTKFITIERVITVSSKIVLLLVFELAMISSRKSVLIFIIAVG